MNYSVKSFNFSIRCRLYATVSLFMACKERCNLFMNRASLDHESLDRVSWTSTTLQQDHFLIFKQKFLYFFLFMFWFAWNATFSDTVNSKALLLKWEYFKNIFRFKSEKKKKECWGSAKNMVSFKKMCVFIWFLCDPAMSTR